MSQIQSGYRTLLQNQVIETTHLIHHTLQIPIKTIDDDYSPKTTDNIFFDSHSTCGPIMFRQLYST